METQRRRFPVKVENMGGKVAQLKAEIHAWKRAPGQHSISKTLAAEIATPSSSNNQRRKRQVEDQKKA